MSWTFDPNARRYRDSETGHFLSRERALEFANQSVAAAGSVTDGLAGLVSSGRLAPNDWRLGMREEIKGEYIRQYLLGRGGLEQMTSEDWGSIGGMIADQYRYLDLNEGSFYTQVAAGDLTEGTIAARSRMYVNSGREARERAKWRRLRGSEFTEVSWVLGPTENCNDCIALSQLGWIPVSQLSQYPGGGGTECLTNCQCILEYRNPETEAVFERALQRQGRASVRA